MFIEREARIVVKSTKMLTHYLHHFGEIRNVIFRVRENPLAYGSAEWEVILSIFPAKKTIRDFKTNENKTLPNDIPKLCTMLELCPDIVVLDKKTDSFDQVTYKVESVNHDLNFIRSDFFKL